MTKSGVCVKNHNLSRYNAVNFNVITINIQNAQFPIAISVFPKACFFWGTPSSEFSVYHNSIYR
jgi:hypothetical protein